MEKICVTYDPVGNLISIDLVIFDFCYDRQIDKIQSKHNSF